MARPILEVENLGKCYRIHHVPQHDKIRVAVTEGLKRILRGRTHKGETEEIWALREVAFTLSEGEVLGIIGRNGAGKSTLLKILSRITEPTEGRAILRGRVASLLEVGTGFHPELTGRENVFLNGSILGMTKQEIRRKFDEIVAFAEVDKFLDTPVKRYSSGMYVRLAFAVAAHLEPEVLLVDEVLAVGDIAFQRKCLGKMSEVARSGRTVLFVSHNMDSIRSLCTQGLLLDQGRVVTQGAVAETVNRYVEDCPAGDSGFCFEVDPPPPAEGKAQLLRVCVHGEGGKPGGRLPVDRAFSISLEYRLNEAVSFLLAGIEIWNAEDVCMLSTTDIDTTDLHGKPRDGGVYRESVEIPEFLLMPGRYSVVVFVLMPRRERLLYRERVVQFEVFENQTHLSRLTGLNRRGYISTPLAWSIEHEPK